MAVGQLFWLLVILTLIFQFVVYWPRSPGPWGFAPLGGNLLIFILVCLLGYAVFGGPIK